MKLRCPMRPLEESLVSSLLSAFPPPLRPAAQVSRNFSRLSSKNWAMLTCAMRLPSGYQLMKIGGTLRDEQALAERRVAEHLGKLGQDLQMQVGGAFGNQQHENKVHIRAVGSVERDRPLRSDDGADRLLDALDAPVRDRDALAEPRRAQLLSREQAVEYVVAGDAVIVFEQQS